MHEETAEASDMGAGRREKASDPRLRWVVRCTKPRAAVCHAEDAHFAAARTGGGVRRTIRPSGPSWRARRALAGDYKLIAIDHGEHPWCARKRRAHATSLRFFGAQTRKSTPLQPGPIARTSRLPFCYPGAVSTVRFRDRAPAARRHRQRLGLAAAGFRAAVEARRRLVGRGDATRCQPGRWYRRRRRCGRHRRPCSAVGATAAVWQRARCAHPPAPAPARCAHAPAICCAAGTHLHVLTPICAGFCSTAPPADRPLRPPRSGRPCWHQVRAIARRGGLSQCDASAQCGRHSAYVAGTDGK